MASILSTVTAWVMNGRRASSSEDANDPGSRRNNRILASAGAGVLQRLIQIGSTVLIMPELLRALGAAQFGVWGAAASLAWLSSFADVGTGAALVTLIARSSARGDTGESRRHISGALSFACALAGLIIIAALVAWELGIPHTQPYLTLIVMVGLAVNIPLSTANSVWTGLQQGYVAGLWDLVQTFVATAGLLLAAKEASSVPACVFIVYASLVISNLGSLLHLMLKYPELRPEGLKVPMEAVRKVANEGILYFAMGLAGALSFLLDNVLALAIFGAEASARFTIASRICVAALGAMSVVAQPLWPAFTEAAHNDDHRWIRKVFLRGSLILVGSTLIGSAALVIFGERLLRWWLHGDLVFGSSLLWAIAAWALVQALIRVPHLLLNGLSIVRFQIVVLSVSSLCGFGLKLALSPYLNVNAILWGSTITILLMALPPMLWRIHQWTLD